MHAVDYITPEDAAEELRRRKDARAELERREKARSSLLELTAYFYELSGRKYIRTPVHEQIAEACERWASSPTGRLIITCAPRVGKSLIVSETLPLWIWANDPQAEILIASYAERLVERFGRNLRNRIAEQRLFESLKLSDDSTSVTRFHNSEGGMFYGVGSGGALTGHGFSHILIDDLVKGREEALSTSQMDKKWDWLLSDLMTRVQPGTDRILVMATRWSVGDPTGRILAQLQHEGWEHLHIPALDGEDKTTFGEDTPWSTAHWHKVRAKYVATKQEYAWRSLYQGAPSPDEGEFFAVSDLVVRAAGSLTTSPLAGGTSRTYITADLAASDDSRHLTELCVVSVPSRGKIHVIDWATVRDDPTKWIAELVRLVKLHKPIAFFPEGGPIWRATEGAIKIALQQARVTTRIKPVSNAGSKVEKASPLRLMLAEGSVSSEDGKWLHGEVGLLEQLRRFPDHSPNDDMDKIDSLGIAARQIDEMYPATKSSTANSAKWNEDSGLFI